MATKNFFISDLYLEQHVATAVSPMFPKNYFRMQDSTTLDEVLFDFAHCLYSNIIPDDAVEFPGWAEAQLPIEYGHSWYKVIYAHGMYVAISNGSNVDKPIPNEPPESAPGMIATSVDGVDWTLQVTPKGKYFKMYTILWAEGLGLFVVGGYDYLDDEFSILTSPDGVNWTGRASPALNGSVNTIAWSEAAGMLVASDWFGSVWASSLDGITWTDITSQLGYGRTSVTYSETLGQFVAVGSYQAKSIQSLDGVNWTEHTMPNHSYFEVEWVEDFGLYVAFSELQQNENSTCFTVSPDGVNWTDIPLTFPVVTNNETEFLPCYSLRYDKYNKKVFAVTSGDESQQGFFTTPSLYLIESDDGVTWSITPDIPGMHDYGYSVDHNSGFRDIAFKSATERVILGKLGGFYYTGI